MHIPFVDLKAQYNSIKDDIDGAIKNVISETAFIGGKYVDAFEKDFAEAYGADHCISCGNGTDTLYIIMKMLNIGPGDEVITVANSWISSSETISQTGAMPVFVDCDPVYYTIDESLIEAKITAKTKAIIPVHLFGQACNMNAIREIANKYKLYIIEDCAQSHFSTFENVNVGLFGMAGSFSFYPGKNLGAYGDAGGIITNDADLALKCRMYARHGALVKHQHVMEGINSRMDGLQAAILSTKLKKMDVWTKARQTNAQKLAELLTDTGDIIVPRIRPLSTHSFHLFVIQTGKRDELQAYLKTNHIETAIHYPTPLPFLKAYSHLDYNYEDFPVSHTLSKRILSLPLYPELTDDMILYISNTIKAFYVNNE